MIFQYRIIVFRYKDDDYRKYQDDKFYGRKFLLHLLFNIICVNGFRERFYNPFDQYFMNITWNVLMLLPAKVSA